MITSSLELFMLCRPIQNYANLIQKSYGYVIRNSHSALINGHETLQLFIPV
jgi:hypothetical protein